MTLEKFNEIWAKKANHIFTQEELDKMLKDSPDMTTKYYLQEKLIKQFIK